MKNQVLIIILAITVIFSSCSKDKDSTSNNNVFKSSFVEAIELTEFLAFYNEAKLAEKTYYIQSYSGVYDMPIDDESNIAATIKGDNQPYSALVDSKTLTFSDYTYYSIDDVSASYITKNMNGFYGKSFDLEFNQNELNIKSDGSISNPLGQVYIPKLFYQVTFDNLTQDDKLTSGSKILWDTDINNEHGVVLGIEYYPNTQRDSLNRINYPEHILIGQLIDDNGEFIFQSGDFDDFPSNADLTFYILRGGYTTFEDVNGDKCSLLGMVVTGAGFTISIP